MTKPALTNPDHQCTRCGQSGHRASQCTVPIPRMNCTRCNRKLKKPSATQGSAVYGPDCARFLGLLKPRKLRIILDGKAIPVRGDTMTQDMFGVVV